MKLLRKEIMYEEVETKSMNQMLWGVFVFVTIGVAIATGLYIGRWCGKTLRKLRKK